MILIHRTASDTDDFSNLCSFRKGFSGTLADELISLLLADVGSCYGSFALAI